MHVGIPKPQRFSSEDLPEMMFAVKKQREDFSKIIRAGNQDFSPENKRPEKRNGNEQMNDRRAGEIKSYPRTVIPECFSRESRRSINWMPDKNIRAWQFSDRF